MSARRWSSACGSGVCARVAPKALRLLISRASVWVFAESSSTARLDLRRHRVEGLCEAADLVAALRRQLLVQVAVGDGGRGGGEAPQRLADGLRDDDADGHGDEQGDEEGREGDRIELAERRREGVAADGHLELCDGLAAPVAERDELAREVALGEDLAARELGGPEGRGGTGLSQVRGRRELPRCRPTAVPGRR